MHDSPPSVSLVLPTRNRPETLRRSLEAIATLPLPTCCEVVVVDNASDAPQTVEPTLANGTPVTFVQLRRNEGAAARNRGACVAAGDWMLMLDDDSHPLGAGFLDVARDAPPDVAAIGAEIILPRGAREAGGLPEVIIGCGTLIRRDVFLELGGYDPAFQYYAEEYDLCARLIRAGVRITHDRRFRVLHEKSSTGRDMNNILHKLVRNNGWTLARYAPESVRQRAMCGTIARYREIAQRENAMHGFKAGLAELNSTLEDQPRTPLTTEEYDRFTGLAAARRTLHDHPQLSEPAHACIIEQGKHAWAVRTALEEMPSVEIVERGESADVFIIGTLSPGPMLDAFDKHAAGTTPVLMPWNPGEPQPALHRSTCEPVRLR